MTSITLQSKRHDEVIDITEQLATAVVSMRDGVCLAFLEHTTCGLTILTNEDGIAEDLVTVLRGLVPQATEYVHDSADHVRAHVLSALVGVSVSVPVREGRLQLGRYQGVVMLEFEGPRVRTVSLTPSR